MITYDFEGFLDSVRYYDYDDIILTTKSLSLTLLKAGAKPSKKEAAYLNDKIQGFLYWLKTKKKPGKLLPVEFNKIKPIAENLVAKKQINPEVLNAFPSK